MEPSGSPSVKSLSLEISLFNLSICLDDKILFHHGWQFVSGALTCQRGFKECRLFWENKFKAVKVTPHVKVRVWRSTMHMCLGEGALITSNASIRKGCTIQYFTFSTQFRQFPLFSPLPPPTLLSSCSSMSSFTRQFRIQSWTTGSSRTSYATWPSSAWLSPSAWSRWQPFGGGTSASSTPTGISLMSRSVMFHQQHIPIYPGGDQPLHHVCHQGHCRAVR